MSCSTPPQHVFEAVELVQPSIYRVSRDKFVLLGIADFVLQEKTGFKLVEGHVNITVEQDEDGEWKASGYGKEKRKFLETLTFIEA